MSIISSEAKWAVLQRVVRLSHEEIRGTTKGKEYEAGFIAGATRRPTNEEIVAGAKAFYEALKPAIDKHDRQVAERAFELGCVAVDAEEHGVGCRFTVGQLEELSRDYGRDAYSVNNPYGRGES